MSRGALRRALDEVTDGGCQTLYVHSGLSGIGYIFGGPAVAAGVLREFCDNTFLPTHTYCYPSSPEEPAPVFDARNTPSEMGMLAELFRLRPGAIRSIHSTHSLAGEGPLAAEICAGHYECDTPCGADTPYSRLVHRGASALMLGVSFRYYTPFHTAECESDSAFAYETGMIDRLRFIDENDVLQERLRQRQNRFSPRFHEAGALLEQRGFVRRRPLGRSELLFVSDMSKVHEFLVERLRKIPDFLRSTCTSELV
ncbi:MAG TPA: AAC(3) family N-acetyltransferase [Phycisphaerae bacterium]|nr:AAC(3) family N-acetyltransferase [Phycisphaerae bacterium]